MEVVGGRMSEGGGGGGERTCCSGKRFVREDSTVDVSTSESHYQNKINGFHGVRD